MLFNFFFGLCQNETILSTYCAEINIFCRRAKCTCEDPVVDVGPLGDELHEEGDGTGDRVVSGGQQPHHLVGDLGLGHHPPCGRIGCRHHVRQYVMRPRAVRQRLLLLPDHRQERLPDRRGAVARVVKYRPRDFPGDRVEPEGDVVELVREPRDAVVLVEPEEELAGEGQGEVLRDREDEDLALAFPVELHVLLRGRVHLLHEAGQGLRLEEPRLAQHLGLGLVRVGRGRRRRLGLVGAHELLHGVWPPLGHELLLVGEDELVAGGAAEDGHLLAEDLGLEHGRRVPPHPVPDELLRVPEEELHGLAEDGPPEAARRELGAAAQLVLEQEDDEGEGEDGGERDEKQEPHG